MSNGTIIQQGRFTSAGLPVGLRIRSDFDYIEIDNETKLYAAGAAAPNGAKFSWQDGQTNGRGTVYTKEATIGALVPTQLAAGAGFTKVDLSESPVGPLDATVTAVSTAAIPVVTEGSTADLSVGDVVRLFDVTGAPQLGGIDFTIGNNTFTGTTFSLDYMSQLAVAGTTGSFRKIKWDPIFYPRARYISSITQAAEAVITLTVTHGYTIGQEIRINVPAAYGMSEINGLMATVLDTNDAANTVTVDIDSSAFSAFAFPAAAAVPFSPATITPIGMDAEESVANDLDDATENTAYIGVTLAAGAGSPAGESADVVYWRAYKSFSVDND